MADKKMPKLRDIQFRLYFDIAACEFMLELCRPYMRK